MKTTYAVPVREKKSMTLRLTPPKKMGRQKTINWAKDYEYCEKLLVNE